MDLSASRTAWVIEPAHDPVAWWTTDALRLHRLSILARYGLWLRFFRADGLPRTRELLERARCDVVFVATSWKDPMEDTLRLFEANAKRRDRPRLVFLDTSDPTSSPFFPLLPYVDLFVKKQLLRPLARYREAHRGGHIVADYLSRVGGFDLRGWSFGSELPEELEHRVTLGWSLASARHLVKGFGKSHLRRPRGWAARRIDVHYRAGLGDNWYSFHRRQLGAALEPLRARCRSVLGVGARVPMRRFLSEMRGSRVAVSPFGWGEVTDRDFQAVIHGSVLVKPDMSHLETEPDIYRPGETYVPVRWDGSDVVERCLDILERPDDAQRMARAARGVYRDWLFRGGFLSRLGSILERVDAAPEEPPIRAEPTPAPARRRAS